MMRKRIFLPLFIKTTPFPFIIILHLYVEYSTNTIFTSKEKILLKVYPGFAEIKKNGSIEMLPSPGGFPLTPSATKNWGHIKLS